MTRIDMHTHVFDAGPPLPQGRTASGFAELLADMDRWEVDASVVSSGTAPPGTADVVAWARAKNEELADAVNRYPRRLGAVAALPLPNVDSALAEIEYALDTLGLDGISLMTNYEGIYLGDPRLDPVFDELQRRRTYCFVHPDFPPVASLDHPGRWYEFPFDTTRAMVNLALSGTFDRCPDVRLQWAHLGGVTPYLADRIDNQSSRMPQVTAKMRLRMRDYFARQYYDTGLASAPGNLHVAADVATIDRVVFGTDWPWTFLPDAGTDPQPDLAALREERVKVDWRNAEALVPRLVARVRGAADGVGIAPVSA